jgi:hypothetical protein
VTSTVKDYGGHITRGVDICICCLAANHAALRRKSQNYLARNQDIVSEWRTYVYQRTFVLENYHIKSTKRVGLVQSGHHHRHFILTNFIT